MPGQHYAATLQRQISNLDGLIDWERADRSGGMDVAVNPLSDLLDLLGQPQKRFRTVHIAGTKGKGSVGALIEAGLSRAGLRVGRFSSPHVERYTERFTLACTPFDDAFLGEMIGRALEARLLAQQKGRVGGEATRFDIEVLASILGFATSELEWVVLECGLGGKNDSTNAIDGEIAVLTNVDLEHTAVLGNTKTAIATNKAGIIKRGSTFVTGVPRMSAEGQAVHEIAASMQAREVFVDLSTAQTIAHRNLALAEAVLHQIGERGVRARADDLPNDPVGGWVLDAQAREAAVLPGRMEIFTILKPFPLPVVLDGAHVPFNLEQVLSDLNAMPILSGPCTVVAGFASDKAASDLIALLAQRAERIIFTKAKNGPPAFDPKALTLIAKDYGVVCSAVDNAPDALADAIHTSHGWILVTGSLHLVGELRAEVRQLTE
ncbi:bifunctional folylpolyglutamate synthase/dihydrofolate synthase (plasmid) [Rhizobium sp. B230/85]|uniref:bifunctional folylpolyglutamate synthase/dihydrofolate synthase n=1 Tax=unclassified Rhizobium TaxID=2613769 RepID=UPI001ADD5D02|nr:MULTISPECIES: Mur ligase family protein [unclassified Rhizobium]MBO9136486.1 bifunctional folylpolyglutamate synthase/dihydrofolate synthase [Rhizobium sp. B209b/85]QXZ98565.1 bifunctional folylpolyglutamate synthase/dihydrofolate synthase [Rhizobium sp. B230/85]QXZ99691.1 bifunctional folylpolyglutamate synthase/dihydrofolate synthase [Rhizobium sp. B230/85]